MSFWTTYYEICHFLKKFGVYATINEFDRIVILFLLQVRTGILDNKGNMVIYL